MSNLIEEQDVKSQMFPFGAFKFTDPAADTTPTLSLKAPWTWSANLAFTTVTDANGTVATTDPYMQYYYSTGNSDRTCTLPAATGAGQIVAVYKTDAGTGDVDVTPAGTDKINGYNAVWKINGQFQYVVLQDRAAGEWHVLDCLGTLLEWTTETTIAITSPQTQTWYNPTGASLAVTPGVWDLAVKGISYCEDATLTWVMAALALSTANNAVSDSQMTHTGGTLGGTSMTRAFLSSIYLSKSSVLVSSPTTYYLLILGYGSGALTNLWLNATSTLSFYGAPFIRARRIA